MATKPQPSDDVEITEPATDARAHIQTRYKYERMYNLLYERRIHHEPEPTHA